MYAFLDPMWTRCLFVMLITIGLYSAMLQSGVETILDDIVCLLLFCVILASFVAFVAFLLKGI